MNSDSTTLYAVYNNEPLPEFDCELPVLQHRVAGGVYDGRVAIYSENELEDLREQFRQQREDNGDHIQVAEIEVTDWNVDPETLDES